MMNEKILKKLRMISKSKMGAFKNCRYAFKLSYIDGVQGDANPFFQKGTDVHNFHEHFLKSVTIKNNKLVIPDFKPQEIETNEDYKRNIVKYHMNRWQRCLDEKGPMHAHKYFHPIANEDKITLHHLELVGIPDAVERGFDDKPVPVEVKTGTPNAKKINDYKNDLIWYKLLFEAQYPEHGSIDRGLLYFPESNYIHIHTLTDADVIALSKEIMDIRQEIVKCFSENNWPASPDANKCGWCSYRSKCEFKK